jgi:microcystin-dependent protein
MSATSDSATFKDPHVGVFAKPQVNARLQNLYHDGPPNDVAATSIDGTGQNQPHENRQPYYTLLYCIATQGIFPPRSRGI